MYTSLTYTALQTPLSYYLQCNSSITCLISIRSSSITFSKEAFHKKDFIRHSCQNKNNQTLIFLLNYHPIPSACHQFGIFSLIICSSAPSNAVVSSNHLLTPPLLSTNHIPPTAQDHLFVPSQPSHLLLTSFILHTAL